MKQFTFPELLACCCEPLSSDWERGWREFSARYNKFIHNKVAQRCRTWDFPRLRRQFTEVVQDIAGVVYITLCKNDCQALRSFTARADERVFFGWLATVCARATNRYLQRLLMEMLMDEENEAVSKALRRLDAADRWEFYEMVVVELRNAAKRKTDNRERDIHIFQLSMFSDFSEGLVRSHPCLQTLGYRVVQLVIHRLRKILHQRRKNFI